MWNKNRVLSGDSMKGLDKEVLIKLLEVKNYDYYLEEDVEVIFKVFGDDYYINRDTGEWELCLKNSLCKT